MKLVVNDFVHEMAGLSVVPETEYEAAILNRYWETAKLSKGRASSKDHSANGWSYSLKFVGPKEAAEQ